MPVLKTTVISLQQRHCATGSNLQNGLQRTVLDAYTIGSKGVCVTVIHDSRCTAGVR